MSRSRRIVVFCAVAVSVGALLPGSAGAAGPLTVQAHVISGKASPCDARPAHSPESAHFGSGTSVTSESCSQLARRPLVPVAVVVTNRTTAPAAFDLPLLTEVTIREGARSLPAAAVYIPWNAGGYAMAVAGSIEVTIGPMETCDFVYLVPASGKTAFLTVGKYGRVSLTR